MGGGFAQPMLLELQPGKFFVLGNICFTQNDYIDWTFSTQNSGLDRLELSFAFTNQTGVEWLGWEVWLTPVAGAPTDLKFLAAPVTWLLNSDVFSDGYLHWFGGGSVQDQKTPTATFVLNLPNGVVGNGYGFTIRQAPITVPEPATATTFLLGGGLIVLRLRCSRRPVSDSQTNAYL
jgi:hypothetical protein